MTTCPEVVIVDTKCFTKKIHTRVHLYKDRSLYKCIFIGKRPFNLGEGPLTKYFFNIMGF